MMYEQEDIELLRAGVELEVVIMIKKDRIMKGED